MALVRGRRGRATAMTQSHDTRNVKIRLTGVGANDKRYAPRNLLALRHCPIRQIAQLGGAALKTASASNEMLGCSVRSQHGLRKGRVRPGPRIPAHMIDRDVRITGEPERRDAVLAIQSKRPERPTN